MTLHHALFVNTITVKSVSSKVFEQHGRKQKRLTYQLNLLTYDSIIALRIISLHVQEVHCIFLELDTQL